MTLKLDPQAFISQKHEKLQSLNAVGQAVAVAHLRTWFCRLSLRINRKTASAGGKGESADNFDREDRCISENGRS
jgi:hypothetical protein